MGLINEEAPFNNLPKVIPNYSNVKVVCYIKKPKGKSGAEKISNSRNIRNANNLSSNRLTSPSCNTFRRSRGADQSFSKGDSRKRGRSSSIKNSFESNSKSIKSNQDSRT